MQRPFFLSSIHIHPHHRRAALCVTFYLAVEGVCGVVAGSCLLPSDVCGRQIAQDQLARSDATYLQDKGQYAEVDLNQPGGEQQEKERRIVDVDVSAVQ